MSTWRVIDLTDVTEPLRARTGQLLAAGSAVPLADVSCVIAGPDTTWSTGVIAELARYDIPLVTCDWRGVPLACTHGWSDASRVAARHLAQASLTVPRHKNAWKQIVRAKITGQAANLAVTAPVAAARLRDLARQVRSGDPDNLEARAARTYWTHLFRGEQFTRDRYGGGRNDLLNYGYAILRGTVIRAIITTGLSPTLGIWHRNRANTFALADDLIEPLRPAVDWTVSRLPDNSHLTDPDTKRQLVSAISQPMSRQGSTVATTAVTLAQTLAAYVEGQHARLTVPTWLPPDG